MTVAGLSLLRIDCRLDSRLLMLPVAGGEDGTIASDLTAITDSFSEVDWPEVVWPRRPTVVLGPAPVPADTGQKSGRTVRAKDIMASPGGLLASVSISLLAATPTGMLQSVP